MNYEKLFQEITELCSKIIHNGGDSSFARERVTELCVNYGFIETSFFVNLGNLQGIACTPDGKLIHSLASITGYDIEYTKLTELYQLLDDLIEGKTPPEELKNRVCEICEKKNVRLVSMVIATGVVGAAFTVLFGGNPLDSLVAGGAGLLMGFLGVQIRKISDNFLLINGLLALVAELSVVLVEKAGLDLSMNSIAMGLVMTMISVLGIINGLWALVVKDTAAGIQKILDAGLGTLGIAIGFGVPLMAFNMNRVGTFELQDSFLIQLVSIMIGILAVCILFAVEKKLIIFVVIGVVLLWSVNIGMNMLLSRALIAVMISIIVTGAYSVIVSVKMKRPPIILLSLSILPVLPGANLFYMMYGGIIQDNNLIISEFFVLFATCVAIIFAFSLLWIGINIFVRKGKKRVVQ